jgi:hypothetical protein
VFGQQQPGVGDGGDILTAAQYKVCLNKGQR